MLALWGHGSVLLSCAHELENAMRIKRQECHCGDPRIGRPVPGQRNVEKQLGGPEESKRVSLAKRSDVGGKRGGPDTGDGEIYSTNTII